MFLSHMFGFLLTRLTWPSTTSEEERVQQDLSASAMGEEKWECAHDVKSLHFPAAVGPQVSPPCLSFFLV